MDGNHWIVGAAREKSSQELEDSSAWLRSIIKKGGEHWRWESERGERLNIPGEFPLHPLPSIGIGLVGWGWLFIRLGSHSLWWAEQASARIRSELGWLREEETLKPRKEITGILRVDVECWWGLRMAVVVPIEATGRKSRPASLGVEIHPRELWEP